MGEVPNSMNRIEDLPEHNKVLSPAQIEADRRYPAIKKISSQETVWYAQGFRDVFAEGATWQKEQDEEIVKHLQFLLDNTACFLAEKEKEEFIRKANAAIQKYLQNG